MKRKKTADKRRQEIITEKRKAARTQTRPEIEMLAVDRLVPYAKNAKKHDDRQVAAIAGSIREFGFTNPILIDGQDGIIAGHGRVLAAMKLGMAEVPCIRLSHLDENQRRAYILADNRLAELGGGWDLDMLAAEVESIDWEELESFGLDDMDLGEILAEAERGSEGDADAEAQVDRAEELNRTWGVKAGDLWLVGEHRLVCGDSTKAEDVAKAMGGGNADLCFTSPPYGQQRDYTEESDCSDWDKLMRGVFSNLPMAQDGQVLVNLGMIHRENEWVPYWDNWISWMRENGWRRFGLYVWDQMHGLRGDWAGRCAPSHEFIFHFNKKSKKPKKWIESKHSGERGGGLRNTDGSIGDVTSDEIQPFKLPDSVWRIQRQKGGIDGHPAPFSVPLVTFAMQSWPGLAYEPFLGSGTTMVAAQNLGRRVFGLEISPAYCAVILQRMSDAFPGIEIRKADA